MCWHRFMLTQVFVLPSDFSLAQQGSCHTCVSYIAAPYAMCFNRSTIALSQHHYLLCSLNKASVLSACRLISSIPHIWGFQYLKIEGLAQCKWHFFVSGFNIFKSWKVTKIFDCNETKHIADIYFFSTALYCNRFRDVIILWDGRE